MIDLRQGRRCVSETEMPCACSFDRGWKRSIIKRHGSMQTFHNETDHCLARRVEIQPEPITLSSISSPLEQSHTPRSNSKDMQHAFAEHFRHPSLPQSKHYRASLPFSLSWPLAPPLMTLELPRLDHCSHHKSNGLGSCPTPQVSPTCLPVCIPSRVHGLPPQSPHVNGASCNPGVHTSCRFRRGSPAQRRVCIYRY